MAKVHPEVSTIYLERIEDLEKVKTDIAGYDGLENVQSKLEQIIQNGGKDYKNDKDLAAKLDFLVMVNDIKKFDDFAECGNHSEMTSSVTRHISKVRAENEYLKAIYNYDGGPLPVDGMKAWQVLFLKSHLRKICASEDELKDIHLPAMFRYVGMTNLRTDTTQLRFKISGDNYSSINITAYAHGSHDPVKLKGVREEDKVEVAKKSITSLYNAKVEAKDGVLMPSEQLKAITGQDHDSNLYLTTYVSDFNIQEKDTNVIDVTRKAVAELNNKNIMFNNIAIQSGFYMFEDFNSRETNAVTDSINSRTSNIINAIEKNEEKTEAQNNYLQIIKEVNKSYNDALAKRNLIHKSTNIVFYSLISLFFLSLIVLLAMSGASIIALATSVFAGAAFIFGYNASLIRNSIYDTFLSPRAMVLLVPVGITIACLVLGVGVLTAPFTVPLLAGVAITVGMFALAGIAFYHRSYLLPTSANNTYIAALQSINISLNGDIADVGCQEAKDRTGSVRIMANALLEFYAENKRLPDMNDRMYFQSIASTSVTIAVVGLLVMSGFGLPLLLPTGIFFIALAGVGLVLSLLSVELPDKRDIKIMSDKVSRIIMTDFDANLAGRNTKGGDGVKHLFAYLPIAITRNMNKKTIKHIKSYDEKTALFGEPGIKKTLGSYSSHNFEDKKASEIEVMERSTVSNSKENFKP